jgi:hypothetical protein
MSLRRRPTVPVTPPPAACPPEKEASMIPLLLWILGVPGLIIILLLLIGVIHI